MSSVDNRIVEMQFNNKRFEQNAKETMSTLDRLKEKLNFKDATRDMRDFQSAADSFNLSRIADAVETLGNRFTMLGELGQQVFQRLASAALNAGEQIVKSIFVDQISAGMNKYELETNAVQALYAALKPKGKSLEDIYAVLDKLTAYSDETSYSYTQMADGISKFVAAGQDINKSELVMEGIANAAAMAGVSISDAGIAFRNFSDAIAKGKFSLMDWKSIQNIHMDTEAFKNEVIKTAIELGKLDKEGMITVGTGKNAKKEKVTAQNFQEYLRYGFFDADVIMAVMQKYADRTTELGDAAFKAAQQAKTFTDVLDAVKDAASTGWKTSFKIIFGDLNEAIEFFTPMANVIIELVNDIDEFRNNMLTFWKDAGGRSYAIQALSNLWEVVKIVKEGIYHGLVWGTPVTGEEFMGGLGVLSAELGIRLANITKSVEEFTEKVWRYFSGKKWLISGFVATILDVLGILWHAFEGAVTFFGEIFKQIDPVISAILSLIHFISNDLYKVNSSLTRQENTFASFAKKLAAMFVPITSRLPDIIQKIKLLYIQIKKFWHENTRFVAFRKSVMNVVNAFVEFVPKAIESVIQFGKSFIEMIKNSDEWKSLVENYNKYVKPLLRLFVDGATVFNNALADFFNMDTSDESTLWGKIKKRFSAFDKLGPWLNEKWEAIKKQIPWLQEVEDWWNTNPVIQEIKQWVSAIAHAIDTFLSEDTSGETSIIGKIKKRFEAMWGELGPWLEGKWNEYKSKWPILQQIEDFLGNIFGWGKDLDKEGEEAAESTESTGGFLGRIWSSIQSFISKINPKSIIVFAVAIAACIKVYKMIRSLLAWTSLADSVKDVLEQIGSTVKEFKKTLKTNRVVQIASVILQIAAAMWLLGETLTKVAKLSWDEIARGLAAMAGLFVEEGAFMFVMGLLSKKGLYDPKAIKGNKLLLTAASMWILGDVLMKVSQLSWDEIGRGLTAMAGLFVESGVFTILVNRLGAVGMFQKRGLKGLAELGKAASIWILAKVLKDLASMSWDEIGRGLSAMGGLFLESGAYTILVNRLGAVGMFQKRGLKGLAELGKAGSIWILAKALKELSSMTWDEIGRGLSAMGGLFLESGAYTILMNRLGKVGIFEKRGVTAIGQLGTAGMIWILAGKLQELAKLSWDEIGRGLVAMAGLFTETGAFSVIMGFFSKKLSINMDALNASIGILSFGIGQLGNAMAKLGKLEWSEILKGGVAILALEFLLGIFIGFLTLLSQKFKISIPFKAMFGIVAAAAAIFIMAKAFEPLTKIESFDQLYKGITALAAIAIVLGLFCFAMSTLKTSIKQTLNIIVSAIALAALMIAFAYALTMVKDVDPKMVTAFAEAMVLVALAMDALALVIKIFGGMGIGAAVKGVAVMIIAAAGIGAAIAIILKLVSKSVEDFSATIAIVGGNLAMYAEMVEGIDMDAVNNSIVMLLDISAAFAIIGAMDYGNLEYFKENLTRMGASLKLFYEGAADVDIDKVKAISGILIEMSNAFVEIGGKDYKNLETFKLNFTRMGSSVKIFYNSISGVDVDKVKSVNGALSDISVIFTDIGGKDYKNFADFKTNFTRMGSSVRIFYKSVSEVDTDKINSITTLLQGVSGIFVDVGGKDYKNFSSFRTNFTRMGSSLKIFDTTIADVNSEKISGIVGTLKTISEDIYAIGEKDYANFGTFRLYLSRTGSTLKLFDTNTADFDTTKMTTITGALKQMGTDLAGFPEVKDVGTQVGYIGGAIKLYAESLSDTDLSKAPDTTSIQKVFDALKQALPDDENLAMAAEYASEDKGTQMTDFAIGLTNIATAVHTFAENTKDMDFSNVEKATAALGAINTINNDITNTKLSAYGSFSVETAKQITEGNIDTFAVDIVTLGTAVADFATSIKDSDFTNVDKAVAALVAINTINSSMMITSMTMYSTFSKETAEQIANGSLDSFAADITTLGTTVAEFATRVKDTDFTNVDKAVAALAAISTLNASMVLTTVTAFGSFSNETNQQIEQGNLDTFATDLTTLGTAVAAFADSIKDSNFDNVDKAVNALKAINSLNAELATTTVASFGIFSIEAHNQVTTGSLDTFATDITTLGTAVSVLAESVKDEQFDNIDKAVLALTSIAKVNKELGNTEITKFGPFSTEVKTQVASMSTFGEDIVVLGNALKDFGDNITKADTGKMETGVTVLEKLKDLNKALPYRGGFRGLMLGDQDLSKFGSSLKLLGAGAKDFSESVAGGNFNANNVSAAGAALVEIAKVNNLLPETGGLKSWFSGDEDLTNFGKGLKALGEGTKQFIGALEGVTVGEEITAAIAALNTLAEFQISISGSGTWYGINVFAGDLKEAAVALVEANGLLEGVVFNDNMSGVLQLLTVATTQQKRLGDTKYSKSLKDLGTNVKDFFNEVWNFTSTWTGGDNGKLDKVTSSIVSIFTSITDGFDLLNSNDTLKIDGQNIVTSIIGGMLGDESKDAMNNAVKEIKTNITTAVRSYDRNFYNTGTWIPKGLADGILGNKSSVINAAVRVVTEAILAAEETAGIASPSRRFAEIGMYSDLGLAYGLLEYANVVDSAAEDVSQSALDSVLQSLGDIQDLPIDSIELTPTIRPVLDMSEASAEAGSIGNLFGNNVPVRFNTRDLEAKAQLIGDSTNSDIALITHQMNELNESVDELKDTLSNLKIVLNNGVLVGELSSDIDKALGARMRRGERGN